MDTNIWSTQSSGQISSGFGGYTLNENPTGENVMETGGGTFWRY